MSERFADVQARSSVDNLLRTVQQHHVQLSLMADTKASILITISSIVCTIALSRSGEPNLRPALMTIAVTSLISLLLAIVANDAALYEAAVRDIHSLGVYLYRKKYRFLRFAYVALLAGFIIATVIEAWVVFLGRL